jgi:hypothetical protein
VITFEPTAAGVEIVDAIERHRYALDTGERVSPTDADGGAFRAPVEAAARIEAGHVSLPTVVAVYARDDEGSVVADAEHFAYEELPHGVYSLEVCAPIKLYLRVESAVTISADARRTRIDFGEGGQRDEGNEGDEENEKDGANGESGEGTGKAEVTIGARSYHDHPAATVTTTDDPEELMTAVSTFGSALKTTSPERSYPTLRGHPPTIELGEQLHIPPELDVPPTGVRVEVPPEYGPIFVAAPLAHYLGARLVPGKSARIVTDSGFEHPLESTRGFETEAERVLKQAFLFDCITRTEGIYPVELAEREAIESRVELDFAELYDRSLAGRLEAYLGVPFAAIEDVLPKWKLTTHVDPVAESVETLPFVVNDLTAIRTPRDEATAGSVTQMAAFDEFTRSEAAKSAAAFTRSSSADAATQPAEPSNYVQPETTGSLEQAWVGEGTPLGASKATAQAYRNRLDREPTEGAIEIAVVCNDPEMDAERADVDSVYGSRAELPFEVSMHHDLTVAELESILTSSTDFVHYIGHIEADGFECTDGKLDGGELESVGVGAFFLNGCTSYEQGMALVEAGAIGGVVTLSDVINSGALRIGRAMARLLNCGFPLGVALELAREESVVGAQYLVVGDGGLAVAQAQNNAPNLCDIESVGECFRLDFKTYPTSHYGIGSMIIPYVKGNETYSLSSGTPQVFELTRSELERFLSLEDSPVQINDELYWWDQVDLDKLY